MMLAGALYRARQFFLALRPKVASAELGALDRYLDREQQELFRAMKPQDQQHCLKVFRKLAEAGYGNRELLQAALLHDVGKALGHVRLWHRVATVLIAAVSPQMLARLGSAHKDSWRYPFYVMQNHGRLGAEAARKAGCSPTVQRLIESHTDRPTEELGLALRQADGEGY